MPDREQSAADGWPGDADGRGLRLVDGERVGKLLRRDDRAERAYLRGVEERVTRPFDERDDEDRPEQRMNKNEYGERGERYRSDRVGADHQATSVVSIGDKAGGEAEDRNREETRERDETRLGRRVRQLEHQERVGDRRQRGAARGEQSPRREEDEVSVASELLRSRHLPRPRPGSRRPPRR